MNISDEAVEAAHAAFLAHPSKRGISNPSAAIRAALEAAAPHLMAAAWDEGANAPRDYSGYLAQSNPYGSAGAGE